MDSASLGVTDEYFIDGFHGSDVVYALMVVNMIDNNSKLEKYVDNDKLEMMLSNAHNGLVLEKPDERK